MQCPSCGFENMPGSEGCARCGSSMRLTTLVLDVNPPRAGDLSGGVRRLIAIRRWPVRLARRLNDANAGANAAGENRLESAGSAAPLLWRLPIPGWSQLY